MGQNQEKSFPWLDKPVLSLVQADDKIFCVRDNDTIETMLQVCGERKVTATPVYSATMNTIIGISDVSDVMSYIVGEYQAQGDACIKDGRLLHRRVCDIMGRNPHNRFILLNSQCTVYEAAAALYDKNVYRVAVLDETHQVAAVISQSWVLQFIQKHFEDIVPDGGRALSELTNMGSVPVKCVPNDMLTIAAFDRMVQHGISCVGIVNEKSKVIECALSMSHLKGLKANDLHLLLEPVKTFVGARQIELLKQGDLKPQVLTGSSETTLRALIETLNANKFHHFFITNAHLRPLRVISLGDILAYLMTSKETKGTLGRRTMKHTHSRGSATNSNHSGHPSSSSVAGESKSIGRQPYQPSQGQVPEVLDPWEIQSLDRKPNKLQKATRHRT